MIILKSHLKICDFCYVIIYGNTIGVRFSAEAGIFFFLHHHVQTVTGAIHCHNQLRQKAPSPGLKRLARKDDHLPSSNVDVKKEWRYTSTLHASSWLCALLSTEYVFIAFYLVTHRDKFIFTFNYIT